MSLASETPSSPAVERNANRWPDLLLAVAMVVLTGLLYVPLLHWLGTATLRSAQLTNGLFLVLLAMAICARNAYKTLKFSPAIELSAIGMLALSIACLWLAGRLPRAALPLVLFSFCLSFAAVASFLFGKAGARQFLPALGAFFVFGLLAWLVPTLDWPLRRVAARYAGQVLGALGANVQVALVAGRPPELILAVGQRLFVVATECNGFGLLTSALLVATILLFQYRLAWPHKISLFLLAIPLALIANFLRIVTICWAVPRLSLPYGVVHESIGILFYYVGLGAVWGLARWLAHGRKKRTPAAGIVTNGIVL